MQILSSLLVPVLLVAMDLEIEAFSWPLNIVRFKPMLLNLQQKQTHQSFIHGKYPC
jgi:hypothetical protein